MAALLEEKLKKIKLILSGDVKMLNRETVSVREKKLKLCAEESAVDSSVPTGITFQLMRGNSNGLAVHRLNCSTS